MAEVGEFGLLAALLPSLPSGRDVLLGPGDDCAVVRTRNGRLLLTIDAMVENVHFRRDWLSPTQLGKKAFRINASDIAAMGGLPRWGVLHINAPPQIAAGDVAAISRAAAQAAAHSGACVVGGNLSRASRLAVVLALIGAAPRRVVRRAGARPGDLLYVTGSLGEAALGVRELRRNRAARGPAVRRFREPPLRLRVGTLLARSGVASAMIDVSDGLVQDLGHLCAASRVGARVEIERLPVSRHVRQAGMSLALAGGEDYELLCAVPARRRRRLEGLVAQFGCPFTCIGACVAAPAGVRVVDAHGRIVPVRAAGHDHFGGPTRR